MVQPDLGNDYCVTSSYLFLLRRKKEVSLHTNVVKDLQTAKAT